MFTGKRRKSVWRPRAIFRSKNQSKAAQAGTSSLDSTGSDTVPTAADAAEAAENSCGGAADKHDQPDQPDQHARNGRNGSKIFSWFRLWRSGNGDAVRPASARPSGSASGDPAYPAAADAQPVSSKAVGSALKRNPQPASVPNPPPSVGGKPTPSTTPATRAGRSSLSDSREHKRPKLRASRSSKSTPKLPPALSHRFSSSFLNPTTVVRRREMQSRPSLQSLKSESDKAMQSRLRDIAPIHTAAISSFNTSANTSSPTGISTAPTSFFSDLSGRQVQDVQKLSSLSASRENSLLTTLDVPPEKPLTPIPESFPQMLIKPCMHIPYPSSISSCHLTQVMNILSKSLEDIAHLVIAIATVEITASAKIFFETHFNNIFSTPVTPRSQRRRKFEQRLVKEELTSEERAQARQEWARKESMHLRQLRSLKTRSLERAGSRGINVAGYEVVKVLGKGSFGVVRLVKEVIVTPKPVAVSNIGTPAIVPTDRTSEASAASSGISKISSRVPRAFATRERSHTETCVYAMKVIRKSSMLRNSQEAHLRAERDFLVASEGSRWIVPLIASFQDGTNLYLVMEYMVGGDFLGLLIREQVLDEDVTKWYIAEMILCIEEAHALKWIHRDVKPDNFLISALGHLKISDFGLAFDGHWAHDQSYFHGQRWSLLEKLGIEIKGDAIDREEQQTLAASSRAADAHMAGQGKDQKHNNHSSSEEAVKKEGILNWRNRTGMRDMAKSMVGTSQYMAPEVIRGDPYDGRCDWWSLGIILYECLYGYTPFCMDSRNETKKKILQHATSLKFPEEVKVSADAMDLMRKLLQEKELRLSCRKYTANDFRFAKRAPADETAGARGTAAAEPEPRRGTYVYADDAQSIKAHPFFRDVPWTTMHRMKPPFVPRVRNWEDTRYFEEEEPISDVDDAPSSSASSASLGGLGGDCDGFAGPLEREFLAKEAQLLASATTVAPSSAVGDGTVKSGKLKFPWSGGGDGAGGGGGHKKQQQQQLLVQPAGVTKKSPRRSRDRRRPRDKLLRDYEVGKQVLDLRKRSAFLGYTYRRPAHGLENEPVGRGRVDRRSFWEETPAA